MTEHRVNPLQWLSTKFASLNHSHSEYLTEHQDIAGKENIDNKVTSWSSPATDTHYPSEKLIKDSLDNLNSNLNTAMTNLGSNLNTAISTVNNRISNLNTSNIISSGESLNNIGSYSGTVPQSTINSGINTQLGTINTKISSVESSIVTNKHILEATRALDGSRVNLTINLPYLTTITDPSVDFSPLYVKLPNDMASTTGGVRFIIKYNNGNSTFPTQQLYDMNGSSGIRENVLSANEIIIIGWDSNKLKLLKILGKEYSAVAETGSYNDLTNKPTIPSKTSDLTNDSGFLTQHQSLSNYVTTNDSRLTDARTPTAHNHNDLYYTETEVNTLLDGKSDTDHTHSQYLTSHQSLNGYEQTSNKVTSLDSFSTDTEYPSAKAVYDELWTNLYGTIQNDYNDYVPNSSLGSAAFSNDYEDLDNLPSLGNLAFENDVDLSGHDLDELSDNTNLLFSGDYTDLDNKPTIPTQTSQLTNNSGFITSSSLSNYLQQSDVKDNLTSTDTNKPLSAKQGKELKTLVDGKANSTHSHSDLSQSIQNLGQTISGLAEVATSGDYDDLINTPENLSDFNDDIGYLTSHQSLTGYLQQSDVKNNLTSTDTNKPLSANQGKELKALIDSKEDNIEIFAGSVVRTSATSASLKAYTTSSVIIDKIILYKVPDTSSIEQTTNVALDYYMNNQTMTFNRKYIYKNNIQLTFGEIESNSWILLAYEGTLTNGQWNLISSSSYLEETTQKTVILSEGVGKYARIGEYVTVTGSGGKTITENNIQCAGNNVRYIEITLQDIARISNAYDITLSMQNTIGTITMTNNKNSDNITLPNQFFIHMAYVNNQQILSVDITDTDDINVYTWEGAYENFPTIRITISSGNQVGTLYITEPSNTISAIAGTSTQMNAIANIIYPIGSIYMSVNSTSPQTLFGGVWEQLKDRFLLGAGDTYANESTGGSATVTLTSAQSGVPAHSHKYQDYNTTYTLKTTNRKPGTSTAVAYGTSLTAGGGATERTSSNNTAANASQAHENMPPYLTVYMWKRIA